jgi:hypothetical protein
MEAEGPRDFVEKHYGSFSERIPQTTTQLATIPESPASAAIAAPIDSTYADIFRVQGKFVTLTAPTAGKDAELDGMLLILLGHKELRNKELVSADELLYGMKQSGFAIERTDRLAGQAKELGYLTKTGIRRGTEYRLTNPGFVRAKAVADRQLANVA